MSSPLLLIANPGSASRKYALFEGPKQLAKLHFEHSQGSIICTLHHGVTTKEIPTTITALHNATSQVLPILEAQQLITPPKPIGAIGLRIVAPGAYFLRNHSINDEFYRQLNLAHSRAPLHITATLSELKQLQGQFAATQIIGVSDSAFHSTKPSHAWNYGIPLHTADTHDIKRFGYHGLSVASVVRNANITGKVIVCHLGSGASVTAVEAGKSSDTTMGFSPLEGLIMGTRSGSIDASALAVIKQVEHLNDQALETYLNTKSGLLGLGGTADIRELLTRESSGDAQAALALATFVYSIQKGIGAMAAAINGADTLIFTGTIGERSAVLRQRIAANLSYLGFLVGQHANTAVTLPVATHIQAAHSKPVLVIPTREEQEIALQILTMLSR